MVGECDILKTNFIDFCKRHNNILSLPRKTVESIPLSGICELFEVKGSLDFMTVNHRLPPYLFARFLLFMIFTILFFVHGILYIRILC